MVQVSVRKIVGFFICAALLLYVGFLCLLYFFQGSLIYPGTKNQVGAAPPPAVGMEVLRLATSAGNIEALFLPATDESNAPAKPLVIYAHGNGEVTDFWVTALDGFRERGIGVLLVEYPGYGRSSGKPSEQSIRIAMDAACD